MSGILALRWMIRTGMSRLRVDRVFALVMFSQTAPGLLHRVAD
jgi:hypothetical protein